MRKLIAVLAFALLPIGAAHAQPFCPGVSPFVFNDVLASDPFCGAITFLAQNGVTLGCEVIDPNTRRYCPTDSVRRDQMAAFMQRLSNALFPLTCAPGQVLKWNGLAWTCANDSIGGSGGGGTVTSVAAGTGLTATPSNPITGAGVLNLALPFQLPQGCANGQVPRSNGAGGWTCGAVAFAQGGNAFSATAVLGTTDNQSLDIRVNNARVMRYEPNTVSPNVIGGSPANSVTAGVRGATIAGGGVPAGDTDPIFADEAPNRVTDAYGTVGGGYANRAGDDAGSTTNSVFATVGGGFGNTASGRQSTVGGGQQNTASGSESTVGGGLGNTASGGASTVGGGGTNTASGGASTVGGGGINTASGGESTVGGGRGNTASGGSSTVGGGQSNTASGSESTVAGGVGNTASGVASTVGGGQFNTASGNLSWAGGLRAKTQTADATPIPHDGAFVWADAQNFNFQSNFHSTANNEFAVRATGGARFVTAVDGTGTATATFSVAPDGKVGINTVTPSPAGTLTIRDAVNPSIFLQGTTADQIESGRIRFSEGTAASNCRGAYLHLDGAANRFNVGVHATSDCDTGNDIAAIQISRGNGFVGLLTAPSGTNPIVAGSNASNGNGAFLTPTGVWTNASSRTFKEGFEAVDARDVLERVAAMPITAWHYTGDTAKHIGPTAEDFKASFGLGGDERYIGTVDADGVALAAIQGLNAKLEAKIAEQVRELEAERTTRRAQQREVDVRLTQRDAEVQTLREGLARQRAEIAELRATRDDVATLKAAMAELLRERAGAAPVVVPTALRH